MADEIPDVPPSSEELAALELYHQLVNMSVDDGDFALRLTLRLPNGQYAGDVKLSAEDVKNLADAAMGIALVVPAERRLLDGEPAAAPLPIDEDEIESIGDEAEAFLKNGGQA
jgi:hypothetical protein